MHYYSGRCLRQGSKSKSFKASTSHCNRILLIPKIGLLVGILSLLSRLVGPAHSRVDLLHCSGYPFFCYAPHIDPIKRSLIEGILPHDELGRAPSYLGPFSSVFRQPSVLEVVQKGSRQSSLPSSAVIMLTGSAWVISRRACKTLRSLTVIITIFSDGRIKEAANHSTSGPPIPDCPFGELIGHIGLSGNRVFILIAAHTDNYPLLWRGREKSQLPGLGLV